MSVKRLRSGVTHEPWFFGSERDGPEEDWIAGRECGILFIVNE